MTRDNLDAMKRLDWFKNAAPAILPSVLPCDFGDLRSELAELEAAGARVIHLDVMDGHFVPNLTFGMPIVAGIRKHTTLPLDVHLMISEPLKYASEFVDAGADVITFHVEAVEDAAYAASEIRKLGVVVGVALDPETPLADLEPCLSEVDMVLVMSVKAGFGGQQFSPVALEKLRLLRASHPDLLLEIDGGIHCETIRMARQAGCDLFVAGSSIITSGDYAAAIDDLACAIRSVDERQDVDSTPGVRVL